MPQFDWYALVAALACAVAAADEPADARKLESALQAAIARAEPAIACLLVRRDRPDSRKSTPLEDRAAVPDYYGSGVVIDPQGLVLTNYHVVRDGHVYVRLPGRRPDDPPLEGYAQLFAADTRSDLAVLKVPFPTPNVLPLGAGEDLRKGSFVVALGHPYAAGFRDGGASASWGVVSNLRRRLPTGGTSETDRNRLLTHLGVLVQTDARLQLGSSGGALIDLDGRLVALTTATAALTGVDTPGGFALPVDAGLRRIIEVLQRGEEVEYGFLGVSTSPDFGRDRPREGVEVRTVTANTPAAKAGLQPGDVILQVNGQPIREYNDLFLHLGIALAGRRCELLVRGRFDRAPRAVAAVLVKAPPPDDNAIKASVRPPAVYGLRVDYTSVIAARNNSNEPMLNGVVVREVMPSSAAKQAGLAEGVDVITAVNDRAVNTPAEFYREAKKASEAGDKVRLTLRAPVRTITLPN